MPSSPACGCCVCPTHAAEGSGPRPGGPAEWAGPAREHLEKMVAWLDGPEAMSTGHGDLEAWLSVDGREQQRLLMQGHLNERAARETRRTGVTGSDGVTRPRVEKGHHRQLTSVFGTVTVTRKAYRAAPAYPQAGGTPGDAGLDAAVDAAADDAADAVADDAEDAVADDAADAVADDAQDAVADDAADAVADDAADAVAVNLYPADAVLNLPVGRPSAGLARLVAVEAAGGSFQEVVAAIERATGVRLGKRQVEELARHAAVDVDAFYTTRRPAGCTADQVLVLQADGKGVVMRPDGLREATAKAAAKAGKGKLTTRLSPGEKRGRKRMAEVVAVGDVEPIPRSIDDIIPAPVPGRRRSPQRRRAPVASGKWLNASVTNDIRTMIKAMFDEAERRDPAHLRTWVALMDGNRDQLTAVQAEAAARNVTVTIIVDFIHVIEYVWKAAWTFFNPGDPDAETWVADQARTILAGRAVDAAAAITHQADAGRFTGTERKGADEAVGYLTSKRPYLDYAAALRKGWPIATGLIEGACRYLVKDRMDITGARWSLPGAEAILKLRALCSNGDFDAYWSWHQQRELARNHLARYQELDLAA